MTTEEVELGTSREGRPVVGYRFAGDPGSTPTRVSLLAGCHADEPVGPRLLRHLVDHLKSLPQDDPLLAGMEWWIVPHANPDGEERNRGWQGSSGGSGLMPSAAGPAAGSSETGTAEAGASEAKPSDPLPEVYDLPAYLTHAVRELPGDDMEFGFPRGPGDRDARPENQAIYRWWRTAPGPFHLHVSLHGMGFAAGPWLLIEPTWAERARPLREAFRERARELGYVLHDVERLGEKGFFRLERGFATRPDSRHMRDHFLARGDPETASRFRPSSMETIRRLSLGSGPGAAGPVDADPLTLVTEMPLFLTPGAGETPGPPDPAAKEWKDRIDGWRGALAKGAEPRGVREEARTAGLTPMPVRDQMALQWEAVAQGIELVRPGAPAACAPPQPFIR